ncbi:hypothetical protein EXU48_17345 [Occultella glacieicola]|uniref:Uncharacterized protein n=1 Tax=Occultella glacieicola TaxID=2518684 RepID=A0ABY2E1E5_9MICO|nr:hypothetical protein [Occultella glacieicola]TDE90868.1 hypothetical protein EXU48_17345 [Occultella glacieicola]
MTARPRSTRAALTALVALVLLALAATGAPPARATTGGAASATGVDAIASEVDLTVTTTGAIGALQPVIDLLTEDPILRGQTVTRVQVGTPAEPSGTESDAVGPVSVADLVVIEAVTADTARVENETLSARSGVGGANVTLFAYEVLDVGPVTASATTHPTEAPTADAAVTSLSVFGSSVTIPDGEFVDLDLALSTDQVLDLLEEQFPGLSSITRFIGSAISADGAIEVTIGSVHEVDEGTGSARAVGLSAEVGLDLHLELCLPDSDGGCRGSVAISTNATVLDLTLAEAAVERPEALPEPASVNGWVIAAIVVAVAAVGVTIGVIVGTRRARRQGA